MTHQDRCCLLAITAEAHKKKEINLKRKGTTTMNQMKERVVEARLQPYRTQCSCWLLVLTGLPNQSHEGGDN